MIEYTKPLYKDFKFSKIINIIQDWSWRELSIGLDIGLITNVDIINYAKTILQNDMPNFDMILEIAIGDNQDEIKHKMQKIIDSEGVESTDNIMDKWRFAMLLDLYFNRKEYSNVYEQVAEIATDFNHPKDMDGFIYYMPADGISLDISWLNYLKQQCERFNVDCVL